MTLTPFRLNILFKSDLRQALSHRLEKLNEELKAMSDAQFSLENGSDLVDVLTNNYAYNELPEIFWKEGKSDITKIDVKGSQLPPEFDRSSPNMVIERKVVNFHIPFGQGDDSMLVYKGGKLNLTGGPIRITISGSRSFIGVPYVIRNDQTILFTYIDFYNSIMKITEQFNEDKANFIDRHQELTNALSEFNTWLPQYIKTQIQKRSNQIIQFEEYKSQLPFPLKTDENVPETFKPKLIVQKEKLKPRPTKTKSGSVIREWYITDGDYERILRTLFDCGKMWEKYPKLYIGKDEESLRDQLLFVLVPNVDAVVAGEAYNKKGKTDISIKHDNTNLFIGECKIWKGPKGLLETIDQILGYLTWRDSKAAIMNFVPNEDISKVINAANETIKEHPNFVRHLEEFENGWSNYRFHLDGDLNTFITIAIQFYHLPGL